MGDTDFPLPDGFGWQYRFLVWLQHFQSPALNKLMMYLSMLGVDKFYMVVIPIIFWSIHRKIGLRIAYVFTASMYVNAWLKDVLQVLRPVGIPGIRSLYIESAPGYGMPSAHAQGAMTFWLLIARWIRRPWVTLVAWLLILLIGFSRLFLGLHWPLDVPVGWGIGLVFAVVGWWVGKWWTYRRYEYATRMCFAIGIPIVLILIHTGVDSFKYASLLLGMGVGAVLEDKHLHLKMGEDIVKRVCSAVIGIGGLVAIQYVIRLPSAPSWLLAIRECLTGLWGTLGAPYVFLKCGLYDREARD